MNKELIKYMFVIKNLLLIILFTFHMNVFSDCEIKKLDNMLGKLDAYRKTVSFLPAPLKNAEYDIYPQNDYGCYTILKEMELDRTKRDVEYDGRTYIFNEKDEFVFLLNSSTMQSAICDNRKKEFISAKDIQFFTDKTNKLRHENKKLSIPANYNLTGKRIVLAGCLVLYIENFKVENDPRSRTKILTFDVNGDLYSISNY